MESNNEKPESKNVSRSIITFSILGFGAFIAALISMLTVGGGVKEARDQKLRAEEEARVEKLATAPAPSVEDASKILDEQAARAKQETPRDPVLPGSVPPPSVDSAVVRRLADLDLGDIDLQAREAAQRRQAQAAKGPPSDIVPGVRRGAESAMSMPEIFDAGTQKPLVDRAVEQVAPDERSAKSRAAAGDAQGAKSASAPAKAATALDDEPLDRYEVNRPKASPTQYLLAQGSIIDVVLNNEINTQNPGSMQMRVVSDVYDSTGQRRLLIPKGSKIIANYGQSTNRSGLDRIPIVASRVLFADGRAIDLSPTPISDTMGNVGAPAEHHSNLLRAIGPSALVAWIGYLVDKKVGVTAVPSAGQQPTASQSISQQIVPKIEERIASRYGAALPYYTIDAGTRLSIVLAQDLSIPLDKVGGAQ
jgi:type IV secretory pathway VirB10-like protein